MPFQLKTVSVMIAPPKMAPRAERDDGRGRDERVAQAVLDQHLAPGQALRPGEPHVFRAHHVEHGGPLEPAPRRVGDAGERDRRQDQVLQPVLEDLPAGAVQRDAG